jgi:hypothetical protein
VEEKPLFLWWDWGLNSRLCACKKPQVLELYLQSIFSDYFGDGISKTTPVLAVNLNPPDLCLPSSHDYRREPSHQARGPILIPQFTHIRAVESISGVQEAWVGRQRASGPVAKWRSKVQDSFVT